MAELSDVKTPAIIAVGYRVNSKKATRFRQGAVRPLKEYITKGFVLKDGQQQFFPAKFKKTKIHIELRKNFW